MPKKDGKRHDFLKQELNNDLFRAVRLGKEDEVKRLLSEGADINAKSRRNFILHYDFTYRMDRHHRHVSFHISKEKMFVERAYKNITPLHVAIIEGRAQLIESLIKQGADVSHCAVSSVYVQDALDFAVIYNRIEIVELLLKTFKVDVNGNIKNHKKMNAMYTPPIMVAAAAGYVEISKLLIEHHADVNVTSIYNNNALAILQVSATETDTLKLLIMNKALINLTPITNNGMQQQANPLPMAILDYRILLAENKHESMEGVRCKETINFLLRCGAGVMVNIEEWPNGLTVAPQTVLIGMKINGVAATHDIPELKEAIFSADALKEAISAESADSIDFAKSVGSTKQSLNIEKPIFLQTLETTIATMPACVEEDKQNEIDEFKKTLNVVKNTLTLKERCYYAVCKNGFFNGGYNKDSIPETLVEQMETYQKFYAS